MYAILKLDTKYISLDLKTTTCGTLDWFINHRGATLIEYRNFP